MFPSSTKREIRQFDVVVVQRRRRNTCVQKNFCFVNLTLMIFGVLLAVGVVVA